MVFRWRNNKNDNNNNDDNNDAEIKPRLCFMKMDFLANVSEACERLKEPTPSVRPSGLIAVI